MVGGRESKEYFVPHENCMKFKFPCPYVKFFIGTQVHLIIYILSVATFTPKEQSRVVMTDHVASKAETMCCLAIYREGLRPLLETLRSSP